MSLKQKCRLWYFYREILPDVCILHVRSDGQTDYIMIEDLEKIFAETEIGRLFSVNRMNGDVVWSKESKEDYFRQSSDTLVFVFLEPDPDLNFVHFSQYQEIPIKKTLLQRFIEILKRCRPN